MGNGEASGALHLDVETRNLQSGQVVQGMVYLVVTQPTPAHDLVIYFKGKEKTKWSIRRKERSLLTGRDEYVTYSYSGHQDIVKQRFVIFVFTASVLQPGQYSFPFSVQTPAGLPNTFSYKPHYNAILDPGPTVATIAYKLVAKVEGGEANVKKSSIHLNLTRPVTEVSAAVSGSTNARISTWCCLSKGSVKVSADFDKNMFVPGDTATISIDVNNEESQLAGTELHATLTRVVRLRDQNGRQHVITNSVNKVSLREAIAPGKGLMSSTKRTLQLAIPRDETMESAGTVAGRLIECEYFLSGEVEMDGCCMCCGDTPRVSKAMVLYPAAMMKVALPPPPADWNPQAMARQDFVVAYQGPAPSAPPMP